MLLTISGLAGTGKDAVSDILCQSYGFVRVGLADPLKRAAQDFYGFTDDQLWGPSHKRNEPDERYPREHTFREAVCSCCGFKQTDGVEQQCYLSCRYALQHLGTEHGRHCYQDIWVKYAIRMHDRLQQGGCFYDQRRGLVLTTSVDSSEWGSAKKNVIIPDTRFRNELEAIQQAGGKAVRIKRPGVETPAWQHPSETEQLTIPDSYFDYIVHNDGSLQDLGEKVRVLHEKLAT